MFIFIGAVILVYTAAEFIFIGFDAALLPFAAAGLGAVLYGSGLLFSRKDKSGDMQKINLFKLTFNKSAVFNIVFVLVFLALAASTYLLQNNISETQKIYKSAISLMNEKKYEKAYNVLDEAIEKNPGNYELTCLMGDVFLAQDRNERVEEYYSIGTNAIPAHFESGIKLAGLYCNTGQFTKALDVLHTLRSFYPEESDVYLFMGDIYAGYTGRVSSIYYYEMASKADPASVIPYLRLGKVYAGMDMHTQAITFLDKAKELADTPEEKDLVRQYRDDVRSIINLTLEQKNNAADLADVRQKEESP
jgi:tetratricopeptide (TPR) repeat protein